MARLLLSPVKIAILAMTTPDFRKQRSDYIGEDGSLQRRCPKAGILSVIGQVTKDQTFAFGWMRF